MPRLTTLLIALVAVLGLGLAWLVARPAPDALTEAQVRSIVSEAMAAEPAPVTNAMVKELISAALAERDAATPQSQATLDAATLNPLIEDYLLLQPKHSAARRRCTEPRNPSRGS